MKHALLGTHDGNGEGKVNWYLLLNLNRVGEWILAKGFPFLTEPIAQFLQDYKTEWMPLFLFPYLYPSTNWLFPL